MHVCAGGVLSVCVLYVVLCSVYRVYVVHVCAGGVLCACVALRSVYSVHVVCVCTECM